MKPEDVPADLVEAACRARWEAQGSVFAGHFGDVARTWDALAALFPFEAENRRINERHTLAAVLPEIQAQALRDAAEFLDADYEKQRLARDQSSTYREGYLDGHERAGTLVSRRAARLTATTDGPPP